MPLKEIKKICCQFEWWHRDLILLKINPVHGRENRPQNDKVAHYISIITTYNTYIITLNKKNISQYLCVCVFVCGGGGGSLQISIWGCAADVGRVFSHFGSFLGRKFTYFPWICISFIYWWVANRLFLQNFIDFGILMGRKLAIVCKKIKMKWYNSHGSYSKSPAGSTVPNSSVSSSFCLTDTLFSPVLHELFSINI